MCLVEFNLPEYSKTPFQIKPWSRISSWSRSCVTQVWIPLKEFCHHCGWCLLSTLDILQIRMTYHTFGIMQRKLTAKHNFRIRCFSHFMFYEVINIWVKKVNTTLHFTRSWVLWEWYVKPRSESNDLWMNQMTVEIK